MEKPIVGVLINSFTGTDLEEDILVNNKIFMANSNQILNVIPNKFAFRLIQLFKANEKAKLTLYLFSAKDVNFYTRNINGIYFDIIAQEWRKKIFPFPDVLYDRCGGGPEKYLNNFIRKQFELMGIKKLNAQSYFDKWHVYNQLKKNKKIEPHLPITKLFNEPKDLDNMFQNNNKIYLKACTSSRGKKVMSIDKLPESYRYRFLVNTLTLGEVKEFIDLLKIIEAFFRKRKVIMQPSIDLINVDNKLIDMRAEVQRNGNGKLEITAIPVRMGRSESPITTSSFATYKLEEFFLQNLNYSEEEVATLINKINNFVIDVYTAIEEAYGTFGEIGIDFGLDKDGNLWFIECNAKSAKVSICNTYTEKEVLQVFLNPLEYAKFIVANT